MRTGEAGALRRWVFSTGPTRRPRRGAPPTSASWSSARTRSLTTASQRRRHAPRSSNGPRSCSRGGGSEIFLARYHCVFKNASAARVLGRRLWPPWRVSEKPLPLSSPPGRGSQYRCVGRSCVFGRVANSPYSTVRDDRSARDAGIAHAHSISRTTGRGRCERQAYAGTHGRPAE